MSFGIVSNLSRITSLPLSVFVIKISTLRSSDLVVKDDAGLGH